MQGERDRGPVAPPGRRLRLGAGVAAQVRAHARAAAPAEACGALIGLAGADGVELHVARALPLPNDEPSATRYRIGPDAVRAAEAEAAEVGLQVVGFYHSHAALARPSASDAEAAWPWYSYLIADVATGELRAWRLAEDRSAMLEDELTEEGA